MLTGYVRCQIPILPVKNIKEALDFYRDMLGFNVAWIVDGDYAAVQCGDIVFHLVNVDKHEKIAPYMSYLFVENADEIYSFYKSQGVEIIQQIDSKPWGVREFTFQDINGHMFRVAHCEKEKI